VFHAYDPNAYSPPKIHLNKNTKQIRTSTDRQVHEK
jgi:hypothetical protein